MARLQLCLLSGLTAAGLGSQSLANAQDIHAKQAISQRDAFTTTAAYVVQFYPLWFTYYQSKIASTNRIAGPDRISPIYHIVVAINDDTLYGSSFLDLMAQPMILKVPATTAAYSVLTLDPFGDIFARDQEHQHPIHAVAMQAFGRWPASFRPTCFDAELMHFRVPCRRRIGRE